MGLSIDMITSVLFLTVFVSIELLGGEWSLSKWRISGKNEVCLAINTIVAGKGVFTSRITCAPVVVFNFSVLFVF